MSKQIVTQHVTATLSLVGRQNVTVDSHGTNAGPGSHLTVAFAGVILWFYDRPAVQAYRRVWTETAARIYAASLPATRDLQVTPVGQFTPTVGVRATSGDVPDVQPLRDCLIVRMGHLSWAVYDRAAFQHQTDTWERVAQLAELVLPEKHTPTLPRR